MSKVSLFIRTPYNYDRNLASKVCAVSCQGESRTQQHLASECDINNILKKFSITGVLPQNRLTPRYGDFTGVVDYHACLNAVRSAKSEFDALPAALRARFGNDPANLIEFLNDEANRDEAIAFGLVPAPEPEPKPLMVTISDPTAPAVVPAES